MGIDPQDQHFHEQLDSSCSLVSYQVCLKCCSLKVSTDRQHHQEHGQVKGKLGKHPQVTRLSRLAKCL